MSDARYVQIIVNPVSGRSGSRRLVSGLCSRLAALGWGARVGYTCGRGDASRLAAQTSRDECRAIVVVGGDGTVREAAEGATKSGMPILVLPTGTENLLAKYFNMRCDVVQVCNTLEVGSEVQIDVAEVTAGQPPIHRQFLLMAGMGFDADVVRRLSALRKGHITHGDYFWPIWRSFWTYRHPRVRVETEDGVIFHGPGMVFVGNIPRYAIGLQICRDATPKDGRLDVCIFECQSRAELLWHAVKTLLRRHIGSQKVIYRRASRIQVSADERVDVQLDGDLTDPLPAEFAITSRKSVFLVSPDWRA